MNTALVLVLFIVLPKESGETPATPRLGPKPQRSQKNINLAMETGPIILHQRHAPDVLPVGARLRDQLRGRRRWKSHRPKITRLGHGYVIFT